MQMVQQLKEIGVNEIACLIDFGVPSAMVLDQLPALNRVKELATAKPVVNNLSIPDLIERHGVTHFQCTPSMASMLLGDSSTKAALGNLQTFLLGGEALAASLATTLKEVVSGNIVNMYGPTETTIWSTTFPVDTVATATVSIGTPIANTQVYILDSNLQPVPTGVPGELYIGGDGVVRGYLNRANLTAERFIVNPFTDSGARLYKTGDLVRYRPDGQLEFLGRLDHQVKLRGYRIELGEIESLLNQHPTVHETVITMREDTPGDVRLVAYVIARQGQQPDTAALRDYLRNDLPEFMIPAHVVLLDKFPLTPNKKINRNALPAPERSSQGTPKTKYIPPQNELEGTIITIWQELLHIEQIGVNDNFFDLGGHSLLTVQAHRRLCLAENRDISITDMFRFPTVRSLAEFLRRQQEQPGAEQPTMVQKSIDRAKTRREAMLRRRR
jgi:acyl-CoA synthetase (AMP-forming)/AMP-acid ligase II